MSNLKNKEKRNNVHEALSKPVNDPMYESVREEVFKTVIDLENIIKRIDFSNSECTANDLLILVHQREYNLVIEVLVDGIQSKDIGAPFNTVEQLKIIELFLNHRVHLRKFMEG